MENGHARRENGVTPWPEEDSSDAEYIATHLYDRIFDFRGTIGNGLPKKTSGCGRTGAAGLAGANGDRGAGARGAKQRVRGHDQIAPLGDAAAAGERRAHAHSGPLGRSSKGRPGADPHRSAATAGDRRVAACHGAAEEGALRLRHHRTGAPAQAVRSRRDQPRHLRPGAAGFSKRQSGLRVGDGVAQGAGTTAGLLHHPRAVRRRGGRHPGACG